MTLALIQGRSFVAFRRRDERTASAPISQWLNSSFQRLISALYHPASLTSLSVDNIENQYLVKGAMFYTNTWQTCYTHASPFSPLCKCMNSDLHFNVNINTSVMRFTRRDCNASIIYFARVEPSTLISRSLLMSRFHVCWTISQRLQMKIAEASVRAKEEKFIHRGHWVLTRWTNNGNWKL